MKRQCCGSGAATDSKRHGGVGFCIRNAIACISWQQNLAADDPVEVPEVELVEAEVVVEAEL